MTVAKSIPKYIITATNHIKSKQCSQPMRIPNNCLYLAQSMGKIVCTIIIIITTISKFSNLIGHEQA